MIPQVRTERLLLRGMSLNDFPRFAEIWSMPEVVRFIGGKPRSEVDSWAAFLRNAGNWTLLGYGNWGVYQRESGHLIGQVGFFMAKRGLGADFDAAPECGWVLAPQGHGRGLGRKAVEAAHRWFDEEGPGGASFAMIEKGHAASDHLARAMGYGVLREDAHLGDPVILYRRDVAAQR